MDQSQGATPRDDQVREIVGRIVAGFSPQKVIVFGSTARGEARPDSDIDLLVVMPVAGSRRRLATEIERSLIGIPVAIDLLVMTPEEVARGQALTGPVVGPALLEGRVVYERAA